MRARASPLAGSALPAAVAASEHMDWMGARFAHGAVEHAALGLRPIPSRARPRSSYSSMEISR